MPFQIEYYKRGQFQWALEVLDHGMTAGKYHVGLMPHYEKKWFGTRLLETPSLTPYTCFPFHIIIPPTHPEYHGLLYASGIGITG